MSADTTPRLLLSVNEACKALGGICPKTLWNYTAPRGTIPAVKIGTRTLYDPRDLQSFIDRAKSGGGSE